MGNSHAKVKLPEMHEVFFGSSEWDYCFLEKQLADLYGEGQYSIIGILDRLYAENTKHKPGLSPGSHFESGEDEKSTALSEYVCERRAALAEKANDDNEGNNEKQGVTKKDAKPDDKGIFILISNEYEDEEDKEQGKKSDSKTHCEEGLNTFSDAYEIDGDEENFDMLALCRVEARSFV
ncbi:hypothetical protein B0T21DRAFT_416959 [Apiosordaria backusii]|uniref:Uncharacterized protein n=1 Tax=Apiosordaria backusii TaxID=314023 RepID=A0AA39ZRX7_9PEZI|nr:hypothetical protein B0T21DRAFT_416959 [Apiosordaria backusii]